MKKLILFMFLTSCAQAGTHIMYGDLLPGGATSYIQNRSTPQTATMNITSGTVSTSLVVPYVSSLSVVYVDANKKMTSDPDIFSWSSNDHTLTIGSTPRSNFVQSDYAIEILPPFVTAESSILVKSAATGTNLFNEFDNGSGLFDYGISSVGSPSSIGSAGNGYFNNTGTNKFYFVQGGTTKLSSIGPSDGWVTYAVAGSSTTYGVYAGSITINTGGLAGQALCWKTDKTLSYCDSVVGVAGACTCH